MRSLHVAVAQINSKAGDITGNFARLKRQVRSAAAVGVEVILFAETVIHAYDVSKENLALAQPLMGPIGSELLHLAKEFNLSILAGFLQREGDCVYNSHLVARPDGRLESQAKCNLTPKELAAGLTAGPRKRREFEFSGIKTAILICADSGIEGISTELADNGVEFCFLPTAGGGSLDQMLKESALSTPDGQAQYAKDRECVFESAAIVRDRKLFQCGFASANALGFDGRSACHRGHCMIVDGNSVLRAQIPGTNVLEHQQDQMAHAVLSFPPPSNARRG